MTPNHRVDSLLSSRQNSRSWQACRRRLQRGRWLWPVDPSDVVALERYFDLSLPAADGSVALVSQGPGDRADLWRFPPQLGEPETDVATMAASSQNAMQNAVAAVRVAVPALNPRAFLKLDRKGPQHLATDSGDGTISVVDGPSFGLGLTIAACAAALRAVPPDDLVALGEVTANGRVLDVSLAAKLRLIAGQTQRVRRVVVSAEQADETGRILAGHGRSNITVIGVANVDQALVEVFGQAYAALPIESVRDDAAGKIRVLRQLRVLLHRGYSASTSWQALGSCSRAALDVWGSLNRPFRQPAALKRTLEPHPRGGADGKRRAQVRRARIDRQFA